MILSTVEIIEQVKRLSHRDRMLVLISCAADEVLKIEIETASQQAIAPEQSIFDSIKHIDRDGCEFWKARELMGPLGYFQWHGFKESINRAKASLAAQLGSNVVTEHFSQEAVKINSAEKRGRTAQDYKLSRYACYLVAMNGDPRKPEIAAAQAYFVTKTREAELGIYIPNANAHLLSN